MKRFKKAQLVDPFVTDAEEAIMLMKFYQSIVRQVFSGMLGSQRINLDKRFGALGHHCLLSRCVAKTKERRIAKRRKVSEKET